MGSVKFLKFTELLVFWVRDGGVTDFGELDMGVKDVDVEVEANVGVCKCVFWGKERIFPTLRIITAFRNDLASFLIHGPRLMHLHRW